MKILITTGIYPPDVGGPAGYTDRIACEFMKLGHKIRVLTYSDQITNYQLQITNYLVIRVLRKKFKILSYLSYFLNVLKYAKGADIIYLQDSVSAGFPTTLANLFLKKRLVLKIVGDYAWETGGNKITPILDDFYPFDGDKYNFKIDVLQKIQTWVAKQADKIITPSNYLKKIVNEGWRVQKEKISVVYNALEPINTITPDRNSRLIVSIGRLVPWKGFDVLINLMPELDSKIRLRIIGEGPEKESLEQLIKSKNLEDRVKLLGKLSHTKVLQNLRYASMFVLNTRYEGLSHVLIEALACGTPVITTNVGGNPEVINNCENGFLVDYDDKLALKSTILKLWHDKNLQEQFGQNGFNSLKKFDFNKMIEDTLSIFNFKDEKLREVLMVSTDKTILDSNSVSSERMRDYGGLCERLHVIVFNADEIKERVRLSENVCVHPTNSFVKSWAILDGISIGKRILENRKISIITTQDPLGTGIVGRYLSWKFKIGLNVQMHGDFFGSDYWRKHLSCRIGKYIVKRANSVRTVSNRVRKSLIDIKVPAEKIDIAPIFTDHQKIQDTPILEGADLKKRYPNNYPILLAVGRLEKEKNYPFLFGVFKRVLETLPSALLVLVGDGSQRDYLKNLAKEMVIEEKIIFEGWKEAISYYKTADIHVLTSQTESRGRTIEEAALCGCGIVMSDVGLAGEFIKVAKGWYIARVNNEDEFVNKIIRASKELPQAKEELKNRIPDVVSFLVSKEKILENIKNSWDKARF